MRKQVPNRKIFDKSSVTNQLVTIASDLKDGDLDQIDAIIALARSEILNDCAYYTPSLHRGDAVICASGERNGKPFLPCACSHCIVGQFSLSGKFMGELIDSNKSSEETLHIFWNNGNTKP